MWYKIQNNQVSLRLLVKPNAKRTTLLLVDDQGLHISLHAKPHEGEANKELISYLSKLLKIPKSQITLQRGEKSRHKQVVLPLNETIKRFLANPIIP